MTPEELNARTRIQSALMPLPADGITADLLRALLLDNPRIPGTSRLVTIPAAGGVGPMVGFRWRVLT